MNILVQILKISTLSLLFAFAINFAYWYVSSSRWMFTIPSEMSEVNEKTSENNNSGENKLNFKKTDAQILSTVWVALTTNVWTKFKQRTTNNLYKSVPAIWSTIWDKSFSNNTSLSKHMLIIREYYNLMRTDIKWMLDKAYDKPATLSSYKDQLEHRYKVWVQNISTLNTKKNELLAIMQSAQNQIESLKVKINTDFRNFDDQATNEDIKKYLQIKSDYTQARTYVIYINQYLKQYEFLNNYNKQVLDVLINNKDVITKNSYVVIPDTWSAILRDMNLLIEEEDFKAE